MKKTILLLVLLLGYLTSAQEKTQILWDTYGVPHIYADDEAGIYKAFGWAQMHNHTDLISRLYRESRGKSAEYWDTKLEQDKILHLLNFPELGKTEYEQLDGNLKKITDAFVSGMNAYADAHPDRIADELKVVLPVMPQDLSGHMLRVVYYDFQIQLLGELGKSQTWKAGSNAWAVGPKLTFLLANPHLPWLEEFASVRFFEAHLNQGDDMLYGVTLIGSPIFGPAFNNSLGWTHTVNTVDNVDLYELEVKDGKYMLDGTPNDFETSEITIKSRMEDGGIKEEKIERKLSKHGVIISETEDRALVLRFPYMKDPPQMFQQWYDMGKATNFDEFEMALQQNAIPLFNVLYADKDKNIFYSYAGNIPDKKGKWEDWVNVVPGDKSDMIWDNYHSYEDLPRLKNPESGWLQNVNDPPYYVTYPQEIKASDYDEDIAPNGLSFSPFRPQQSIHLLQDAKDLTLEKFVELKHSTASRMFFRIKDDLEGLKGMTEDSETLEALNVLTAWDGNFDADSKQAAFFASFMMAQKTRNGEFFETEWSAEKPLSTPDGIKNPEAKLAVLKEFARVFKQQTGALEVPYGGLFKIKIGEHEIPANGGFGPLGVFRTINFQQGQDGLFYGFMGDAYVCATEFGEVPTAKVILSYGNASQKGSKHIGDQLELFAKKEMRNALLTRQQVEANLEKREEID